MQVASDIHHKVLENNNLCCYLINGGYILFTFLCKELTYHQIIRSHPLNQLINWTQACLIY